MQTLPLFILLFILRPLEVADLEGQYEDSLQSAVSTLNESSELSNITNDSGQPFMFKNEYLLDISSPPFKSIFFSAEVWFYYHMTPKVWFLIANHQQFQTLPNPFQSAHVIPFMPKSGATFFSVSPSLNSPFPLPTENYTFFPQQLRNLFLSLYDCSSGSLS